jgi:F0F1-type ATP synthase assembly protein I
MIILLKLRIFSEKVILGSTMKKSDPKTFPWLQLGQFLGLGFDLIVPPLIGAWVGKFLDESLKTSPYLLVCLILVGVFLGVWLAYLRFKKFTNK